MCKLYTILDIENVVKAEKLARAAVKFVTRTDHDGFGIMRLGGGAIHSRKWVTVPSNIDGMPCVVSPYANALELQYAEKGTVPPVVDAIALHGRKATCGVNIENTHPFQTAKTTLMHNGIITNVETKDNRLSTCDSEVLLWRYLENGVRERPEMLSKALSDVDGYYACVVFNTSGVVDIWTDDLAGLHLASVKGVGTVIATTREIIVSSVKKAGFKLKWCYPLKAFAHLRWEKGKPPALRYFTKPIAAYRASALSKEIKALDHSARETAKDYNEFNAAPPRSHSNADETADGVPWYKDENDEMTRRTLGKDAPTLNVGI